MKQRSCDIKSKKRIKYERCHSYAVFAPSATVYYKDFATTLQEITEYPSEVLECGILKCL